MTPDIDAHLAKAREHLSEARKIAGIGLAKVTARSADHAALLAALPSAAEIARQARARSLGIVITDICHDLGLASGMMEATLWEELMDAVLVCGIDLVRFIRGAAEAPIGEEDGGDEVEDAGVAWPGPCVQAAVAACAQPP